jgi:phosphoribosylformimino-5-aminoimidazole carboxamide ribotide isomerase
VEIIPAIDIRGGRCVRLVQGDYDRETVFGDDPVEMAKRWASEGATRLHVVDLDGAKEGRPVNDAIVARIVAEAGVPVQVAGGVRDADGIARWVDAGAQRVVVGTLAVEQPASVEAAVRAHGDRIALAVDARGGKAAVRGWLETSDREVGDFVRDIAARGVRHYIYTEISRDGMMEHPEFEAVPELASLLREACGARADGPSPLVYSGGVTSVEDLVRLSEHEIEGAIVGRALYDGRIDLREARRALSVGDDW